MITRLSASAGRAMIHVRAIGRLDGVHAFASPCHQRHTAILLPQRSLSSQSKGIFSSIKDSINDKLAERQDRKKEEKMLEQIQKVSQLEKLTLGAFVEQMASATDDWKTKIPGMGNLEQVKMAKETKRILDIMVSELGADISAEQMENLDRKDKLRVSVKAEIPISDINQMVMQFKNMDLMHAVLKYRKDKGKKLPTSERELRTAMLQDASKVLSKDQKKEIGLRHARAKMGRHLAGKKR